MKALASGGFQVEELARLHYPNGIFINTENYEYEKAFQLTQEALLLENVVIYEAAFLVDNFFIRTDILVKNGNEIKLIDLLHMQPRNMCPEKWDFYKAIYKKYQKNDFLDNMDFEIGDFKKAAIYAFLITSAHN